jgi:hypothetical protein
MDTPKDEIMNDSKMMKNARKQNQQVCSKVTFWSLLWILTCLCKYPIH